jgi:DNA mismatch repair protein MutS2
MAFQPGDLVLVPSLGKAIVREVRRGHYLVEIKGRTLLVAERQLSPVDSARAKPARPTPEPSLVPLPSRTDAPVSLDLHGLTTAEADVALAAFLNDAMLAGNVEVRVVHGRSGGRLKALVHARLGELPSVRAFRLDPRNAGVTIVSL